MKIDSCRIIDLPRFVDARGSLTFVESISHVPFDIRRLFFLYDVPRGESRGAHAHKSLHQVLICVSGSFDLVIDDGLETQTITLDQPWCGVHVPPMIWTVQRNFSEGAVCLVVASDFFQESDYIRSYEEYLTQARQRS